MCRELWPRKGRVTRDHDAIHGQGLLEKEVYWHVAEYNVSTPTFDTPCRAPQTGVVHREHSVPRRRRQVLPTVRRGSIRGRLGAGEHGN